MTSNLVASLQSLLDLREELVTRDLSPEGAWIHEYTIRKVMDLEKGMGEEYQYAKWQAHDPIFRRTPKKKHKEEEEEEQKPKFSKHKHIGRVSSSTGLGMTFAVEDAYRRWENRKKLEAIDLALSQIEAILSQFHE